MPIKTAQNMNRKNEPNKMFNQCNNEKQEIYTLHTIDVSFDPPQEWFDYFHGSQQNVW